MGKRIAKKVLLLGWDAADWKVINPLMDAGLMPTLEKFVSQGVMGNLATLDPPLSPTLWTSISTGKRPYKHGIHGFVEPDPQGNGVRPVFITSRKVKAIWNILTQHNLKSHVVGWWPGHPAEPINGISVSNFYQKANNPINEPWPMAEGTVHPKKMSSFFEKLRLHPGELTDAHVLPFIPNLAKINQQDDHRVAVLLKILAETASIHNAGTYIVENEKWDFVGIYFDGIDHFCHAFMKYHPPKLKGIPDDLFNNYKDIIVSAYRYHDMMLERYLKLAGEDATVILISDHGFHPDHLRPTKLPQEPAAPALEHSPYGIICMKGPGIKKDERIYGANVLDITPTILSMFGLPVAKDFDGKTLLSAFEEELNIEQISSWEDIAGECGSHPKNKTESAETSNMVMEQLIQLGYIERPDKDNKKAIKKTNAENNFYLSRSYLDGGKIYEAIKILENLHKEYPNQTRYSLKLATSYQNVGRISDCKKIISKLRKQVQKDNPTMLLIEGTTLLSENKLAQAMDKFKHAEEISPKLPKLHMQIARGYMLLGKWEDAERAYTKELEIDKENAAAYHGIGVTYLRRKRYKEAADACLTSVGLLYYFPFAHYHLGEALFYLEDYKRSIEAFEVTLKIMPQINKARQWLIKLYTEQEKNPKRVKQLELEINQIASIPITIVSGLPRSGTSMMMQMLEKGGLEIFTDKKRKADKNNPKGYYEHERVKNLARDKSWLKEASFKAVKIISHLLSHLPNNFKYKVIFMERNINEVLISQQKMLGKKIKKDAVHFQLAKSFTESKKEIVKWAEKNQNIDLLFVSYSKVISKPNEEAKKINQFLGGELNTTKMCSVVDKKLYRNKKEN